MNARHLLLASSILALAACSVAEVAPDTADTGLATGDTRRAAADTAGAAPTGRPGDPAAASSPLPSPVLQPETAEGLRIAVSEVTPETPAPERPPVAYGEALPEDAAARLLGRLPPLEPEAGDRARFTLPERSLPAPRTGETVDEPFPPKETGPEAPRPKVEPLEVVRYTPEGAVPIAPQVSVTFSQPMVEVTTHADSVAGGVPVRLSPTPEGTWRWVGTTTLLFETETRLPMATAYTAEIPAGTRSATGGVLAKAVRWKFETPPPTVQTFHPHGGPQPLEPLMLAVFDQRVDPQAVIEKVRLEQPVSKSPTFALRLATEAEIAADEAVRRLAEQAGAGRWVAFRPVQPLPKATELRVAFAPGLPSAEGPLRTRNLQTFALRTYGPLQVERSQCGWRDECPPGQPWHIQLSNPLDQQAFDASAQVRVEPAVEELVVESSGNSIHLRGLTQARTRYTVTLAAGLRDVFGQSLEEPAEVVFEVGEPRPALFVPSQIVVLDPEGPRSLPVHSVGIARLEVTVNAVDSRHWKAFRDANLWSERPKLPGRRVFRRTIEPEKGVLTLSGTPVDLTPALEGGLGHALVIVRPLGLKKDDHVRPVYVWVQSTRLGLSAHADPERTIAWVTDLATGAPVAGATVRSVDDGSPAQAVTGKDGIAELRAGRGRWLVAEKDGDSALLQAPAYGLRRPGPHLAWYTADDRNLYRTGEKVRVKGWVRKMTNGPQGDVQPFDGDVRSVAWQAHEPRGNAIADGTVQVDAYGGFDLSFEIPASANLGSGWVTLKAEGAEGSTSHRYQIQAFRRPEYEVTARTDSGPHLLGGEAQVTASASYFAGGGLPGADVNWQLRATPGSWRPPGYDGFVFGPSRPWWFPVPDAGQTTFTSTEGKTDAAGRHAIRLVFEAGPPRAMNVIAEGTVTDVNRQAWTARADLLVHPAAVYSGLRTPRAFVQAERPITIEAVLVDLDGRPVPGRPLRIKAERLDWRSEKGTWTEVAVATRTCEVTTGTDPVACDVQPDRGGRWRLSTEARDDEGRVSRTETLVYVAGEAPPARGVQADQVLLIPEQETWAPGDTAKVLVQVPFHPAEALVTFRREGLLTTRRLRFDGPSRTIEVPIEDGHTPGLHLQVDLVGRAARSRDDGGKTEGLPERPAFATGQVYLSVPPVQRTLDVAVRPAAAEVEPGAKTRIHAEVRGPDGKPVGEAQLLVAVVDEAVLSLTGYRFPDPVAAFHPRRGAGAGDAHLRAFLQLSDPSELAQAGSSMGTSVQALAGNEEAAPRRAGAALRMKRERSAGAESDKAAFAFDEVTIDGALTTPGGGAAEEGIALRANLDALALFAPSVVTDAAGRAVVELELPDNLTRYRVMAVATDGGRRFGHGEAVLTARLPLMVRPSAPRFLHFGDTFELPVVVQNQTAEALTVDVAVRVAALELTAGSGRRVQVPARDRVEVRFPARVLHVGTARFQAAAASGRWADAATGALPVWTPGTTEAFATYGTLDEGVVVQPLGVPTGVAPEIGELEVTTSSTALQGLTDAVLYLVDYPYECSEQIASRVLAIAALRDVLTAFEAEGLPPPETLVKEVASDLDVLSRRQNPDGGFGFWRPGRSEWPFLSIHVTHALARARDKGFEVPENTWRRAQTHLRRIERYIPDTYGPAARRTVIAYALYVRDLMGDADPSRAASLVREAGGVKKMPLETLGWLMPVLAAGKSKHVAEIHRHLEHQVSETAATAQFTTHYGDGAYLVFHSRRRTDALLLEGLIRTRPDSDLVVKLVRGLLGHRKRGRWLNTQENAWVLVALDRYFGEFEKATPDFVARAWLGDRFASEHAFRGRSTERRRLEVPMPWLLKEQPDRLILQKEGTGRLYYRIGLRYAPEDLTPDAADHGFTVERTYEAVDDPGDVRRDEDGVWHVRAGAKVRVRLTLVAPARRYHVALEDRLPAGFEAVNPELAVSGSLEPPPSAPASTVSPRHRGRWWWGPWYEHQNLRDERAEAFASLVFPGVYEWAYVARATTPGRFIAPSPRAEEMYFPETFGRGAGEVVVVE